MPEVKTIKELLELGLLKKGNDPSLVVERLPLGLALLDEMLGGGLPLGRCVELYGPESTGKTLIAQYAVAAIQKSAKPLCLYMDMERSFDREWWQLSGVDTESLIVSTPTTGEQAIDIMRAMLAGESDLGCIVVDSIAAMIPQPLMDPEKSSEDNRQPGAHAKVITLMYYQLVPLLDRQKVILIATNQMRDNIGTHDPLASLPGGRANRHYNHIILATRREDWITEGTGENKKRLGFYMEITQRKNKMAATPDGTAITLPFMFANQIDYTTSYIEDAIKSKVIVRKGPYYQYAGHSLMGLANLRQFFADNPEELENVKNTLGVT